MWEIIGYCLLGILLLLLALLIVPLYVRLTFNDELRLCVRVWGIPIFRYSSEGEVPQSTDEKAKPSKLRSTAEQLKTNGVGATLHLVKKLTRLAAGAARRLLAAITVDKLCLQLYIAGSDAAETAETTGKVCAVLYPAVTALQQTVLRIRKRAITVTPDFLAEEGRVVADVTVHVIPIRIIMIAIWLAFRYRVITKRQKEVFQYGKQSAESHGPVD
ncbi:MAG: DUF2953 domain-containing protein [Clostridia bacterium]|nr:DUF2953 domain-containing protein [Clostridia bacterium]